MTDVDVAIVGGGMVGVSLALALREVGVAVMLIEGVAASVTTQPSFDERTTALGNSSRRIFEGLGVWPRIAGEAAAIRNIHVSDAGHFGFARLRAQEQDVEAFSYVVANRVLGAVLWEALAARGAVLARMPARAQDVEISADGVRLVVQQDNGTRESVNARLVVAADGAHSSVRAAAGINATVEDYGQVAIVANVAADRPHDNTAYERFTPSGPLAVLPVRDGSFGVIWTAAPAHAAQILTFTDTVFLRELQGRFGWRAGRFTRAGGRASYPLQLTRALAATATRTVLIGNAAQALHPVAGQGFNLGLRDVAMLAELIANAADDVGAPALLAQFANWRAEDRAGVIRFTDGLVKLFGDSRFGIGTLRDLGLLMFDLFPPAKSALARVSAGFGGPTPRLARGLSLGAAASCRK